MQIAYWKTQDGKRWLRLYEERTHYFYKTQNNEEIIVHPNYGHLGRVSLRDALRHVQNIVDHWPSKGIRQH